MELERKIAADPENADIICAEYLKNPVDITKKKISNVLELKPKQDGSQEELAAFEKSV